MMWKNLPLPYRGIQMELLEYLHILKKKLWFIIIITLLMAIISGLISVFVMDPVYEGNVTLIVGRSFDSNNERVRYDDILMYQKLVKTYSELAKSRLVINEVISKLKYNMTYKDIINNLKVNPKGDTQILELTVQYENPEMAVELANTLSEVFILKVHEVMDTRDIRIMDKAQPPESPVKPRVALNILMAAFIGLLFSVSFIFLRQYLDNTLKTEEDISKRLDIMTLAVIPYIDNIGK